LDVRSIARIEDGRVGEIAEIRIEHIEGAHRIVTRRPITARVAEADTETWLQFPAGWTEAQVARKTASASSLRADVALLIGSLQRHIQFCRCAYEARSIGPTALRSHGVLEQRARPLAIEVEERERIRRTRRQCELERGSSKVLVRIPAIIKGVRAVAHGTSDKR
jgi:hypothetical protein